MAFRATWHSITLSAADIEWLAAEDTRLQRIVDAALISSTGAMSWAPKELLSPAEYMAGIGPPTELSMVDALNPAVCAACNRQYLTALKERAMQWKTNVRKERAWYTTVKVPQMLETIRRLGPRTEAALEVVQNLRRAMSVRYATKELQEEAVDHNLQKAYKRDGAYWTELFKATKELSATVEDLLNVHRVLSTGASLDLDIMREADAVLMDAEAIVDKHEAKVKAAKEAKEAKEAERKRLRAAAWG